MLRTKSIKSQLRLAFGVVCLLLVLQGIVSVHLTLVLQREERELLEANRLTVEISEIVTSHYQWLSNMTLSVYTQQEFTGSLDPDNCSLGLWLRENADLAAEDPQMSSLLGQAKAPHEAIHHGAAFLMELSDDGAVGSGEMHRVYQETISPNSLTTIRYLEQMKEYQEGLAAVAERQIRHQILIINVLTICMAVLCILIAVAATILLIRRIVPPIVRLTRSARELAQGKTDIDLVTVSSRDEVGQLAQAFANMQRSSLQQAQLALEVAERNLSGNLIPRSNQDTIGIALNQMVVNIREILWSLNDASTEIANGSHMLSNGAQTLAQGSVEQAAAVEELSAALTEVTHRASLNAESADQAVALSKAIQEDAQLGSRHMREMIEAIGEINRASKAINRVILVIDDLSFQTNLLALNAAVEASHVGIFGTGFAVVAEKVRDLANRSSTALNETSDLIENCIEKARRGVKIASETSSSLDRIVKGVAENHEMVDGIASRSKMQSVTISQINEGLGLVSTVIQQNSATAQETAATAQEMSAQSTLLANLIAQFQLTEEQVQLAKERPLALDGDSGPASGESPEYSEAIQNF